MGPHPGWMGGWAIILADIIVMANLSQIAGLYSFQLFGNNSPTTFEVTLVGVIWIVVMTWICWRGIELSARTQQFLLGAEFLTLADLRDRRARQGLRGDAPATSMDPSLSWFNPFDDLDAERADVRGAAGDLHLLGMGHRGDRERGDGGPTESPGRAAVVSDAHARRDLRGRLRRRASPTPARSS